MTNEFYSNYYIKSEVPNIIRREKQNIPDTNGKLDIKPYDWHYEEENNTVKFIPCKTKFVADSIGDDFLKWSNKFGILIESPTGSGKSSFAIEQLIRYMVERRKRCLLVSDRITSSLKMKREIVKTFDCEEILKLYSDEGLRKEENFVDGLITIKSYQKLGTIEEIKYMHSANFYNPYDLVVFDEAHVYFSDSQIFPVSGELIELLYTKYYSSIRLYLSATFYDVGSEILRVENKQQLNKKLFMSYTYYHNSFCPICYTFKVDYSYIYALYYKNVEELIELIKSDKSKKKWLIFVDSKDVGEYIKNKLEEIFKNEVVFITAESKDSAKEDNKEYKNLIENEKFDVKICIATSVINTSINIKDSDLTNVIIFSYDRTQFIQMLGRRRRLSKNDKVNLYIYDRSLGELIQRYKTINDTLSAIYWYEAHKMAKDCMSNFNKNYYLRDDSVGKGIRNIFYYDIYGNFKYNSLAFKKLKNDKKFLESLIYRMSTAKDINDDLGKEYALSAEKVDWLKRMYEKDPHAIVSEILNYLELSDTYDEINYISNQNTVYCINKFLGFLIENLNKPLDKDGQEEFGRTFKTLYNEAYGKRKNDRADRPIYGKEVMEDIFEELSLSYKIETLEGAWSLIEV